VDRVAEAAAAWLATPAGAAALAAAVRVALDAMGAPTRPGGPPGRLGDRLANHEALCEDTDWDCPLGPFRDTTLRRGSLGELCAARLTDLSFGLGVVVAELGPRATEVLGPLVEALDDADERRVVRDGLAAALLGPLQARSLASVLRADCAA
jgi:hypothetical protein